MVARDKMLTLLYLQRNKKIQGKTKTKHIPNTRMNAAIHLGILAFGMWKVEHDSVWKIHESVGTNFALCVCLSLAKIRNGWKIQKGNARVHEKRRSICEFTSICFHTVSIFVCKYTHMHTYTHAHAQSETEMNESSKCYELHFACSQKGEKKQQHGIYFRWPSRPPFFHSHSSGGENFIYLN